MLKYRPFSTFFGRKGVSPDAESRMGLCRCDIRRRHLGPNDVGRLPQVVAEQMRYEIMGE